MTYSLKALTSFLNKLSPQVTSSYKKPTSIDAEAHAYFHIAILLTRWREAIFVTEVQRNSRTNIVALVAIANKYLGPTPSSGHASIVVTKVNLLRFLLLQPLRETVDMYVILVCESIAVILTIFFFLVAQHQSCNTPQVSSRRSSQFRAFKDADYSDAAYPHGSLLRSVGGYWDSGTFSKDTMYAISSQTMFNDGWSFLK